MNRPHTPRTPGRDEFIYGTHAVMEALQAGRQLEKILVKKGLPPEARGDLMQQARAQGVQVQEVPVEKLNQLCRGGNHQGVAAFVSLIFYQNLEDVLIAVQERGEDPLLLVLDQVTDVRNFGAITRTAECMGVHAVVVPQAGAARITADAVKISAGALHHLPVCRVHHLADALLLVKQYGLRVAAFTEKAQQDLFTTDLRGPLALLFGAEDTGISPGLLKRVDVHVRIPMRGKIGSLNVGVSTGMALLEVMRQRG